MNRFPGILFTTRVLTVNIFGDAIWDLLDPRLRLEEWGAVCVGKRQ